MPTSLWEHTGQIQLHGSPMPLSLSLVLLKDRATAIEDSRVPFSAHRPDTVALNPTPQSHGLVHLKDREPTSGLSHSSSPRSVTVARIPDAPESNPRLPPLAETTRDQC